MGGRSGRRLAGLVLATALGVGSAGASAAAGERLIEGMDRIGAFTDRWGVGRVEPGGGPGFAWVRVTTAGDGRPSLVANRKPYDPPLDLRGRFLKVWLRVEDVGRLDGISLRLSSDGLANDTFVFRIPLFGDRDFNFLQDETWVTATFSFGAAETSGAPDRAAVDSIGLYVGDDAGGPARVSWGGLAVVDEPPHGIVSLTFDDGYDEHARVAAPVMARYALRGTAYVIPDLVGSRDYAGLEELHVLRDRFGWEVAAHHQVPFTDFDAAQLEAAVLGVQRYLVANGFAGGATHLAYPLGRHDPSVVLPLVRKYFTTARIAGAGPETLPPADRHRLRVVNVLNTTTPDQIARAVARAQRHHEWLILMFHFLVEEPELETEYGVKDFEAVVRAIRQSEIAVLPVGEVWAELVASQAGPPSPVPASSTGTR